MDEKPPYWDRLLKLIEEVGDDEPSVIGPMFDTKESVNEYFRDLRREREARQAPDFWI